MYIYYFTGTKDHPIDFKVTRVLIISDVTSRMIYMGLYYARFEDLTVVTISITVHPVVCTDVSEVCTTTFLAYMDVS
jgi:hypothetical protein